MAAKDFTGIRYGNLTAIRRSDRKTKSQSWLWVFCCDCGNEITARIADVKKGHTKSCGCRKVLIASTLTAKHNMEGTRIYRIWNGMKQRCLNPNMPTYKNYGERGITVCNEWIEFEGFLKWAYSSGYDESLTIDRIDNNKGYCPENCRWATQKEQQNNRRNVRVYEFDERLYTAEELAELVGVSINVIRNRKHRKQPLVKYDELCARLENAGGAK